MASIDQRIVQMRFDNAQFERGVKQTSVSLQQLKKDTSFDGSQASGLRGLAEAAKNVNFSGAISSAGGFASQLGVLQVAIGNVLGAGLTRLASMAQNAMSQFTIQPIIDGFNEYELKLNSVQTILANTAHKGTTINQVTAALDELNQYADQTIYNFGQMTENIGRFTAAGVDLDVATASIKGMSNMAAMAGSSTEQLNTAMYQTSQALAAGSIKLMDWNSLVNAGIGGENFQELYMAVNKVKSATDSTIPSAEAAIASQGNFRESLKKGWLTTEVFAEAAKIMTGELSEEQLRSMGYSAEQAAQFSKMAANALDAATKVKTFTQLLQVIGEAIGSGWATSFEIIFGNLEEAREMWTGVYNAIEPFINAASKARNDWLSTLKLFGTFKEIQIIFQNLFKFLGAVIGPIGKAFKQVFGSATDAFSAEKVVNFVHWLKLLTDNLTNASKASGAIQRTFAGLFAVFHIGYTIIAGVAKIIFTVASAIAKVLFPALGATSGGFLNVTASIGDVVVWIDKAITRLDIFGKIATVVGKGLTILGNGIKKVFGWLADGIKSIAAAMGVTELIDKLVTKLGVLVHLDFSGVEGIGAKLKLFASAANELGGIDIGHIVQTRIKPGVEAAKAKFNELGLSLDPLKEKFQQFKANATSFKDGAKELWDSLVEFLQPFADTVKDLFKGVGEKLTSGLAGLSKDLGASTKKLGFGGIIEALVGGMASGAILVSIKTLLSYFDSLKEGAKGLAGIAESISGAFDSMAGAFDAQKNKSNAQSLLMVAGAVALLAVAVYAIGNMDEKAFQQGVVAIGALALTMKSLTKSINGVTASSKSLLAAAPAILAIGVAMLVLAGAVAIMGSLDPASLIQGVTAVFVLMASMSGLLGTIASGPKAAANLLAAGAAMQAIAIAVNILVIAVAALGALPTDVLLQGLATVVAVVGGFTIAANSLNPAAAASIMAFGAAFTLVAVGLNIMISALALLGVIPIPVLIQGLIGIGTLLTMLALTMNMIDVSGSMAKAAMILALAVSVNLAAAALAFLGNLPISVMIQGAVGLGVVLLELAVAMQLMKGGGIQGAAQLILLAVALNLLVIPLQQFGSMSIGSLATALGALAITLTILIAAGIAATAAAPGLTALSVAMLALGVAVGLVGVGLGLVALGLGTLAAAGMGAVAVLSAAFGALIALLPSLGTAFAQAFINILIVLNNNFPVITQFFVNLVNSICEVIVTCSPQIAVAIQALVTLLIQVLVNNIPQLVDAGMKMLIGILTGIKNNIGKMTETAIGVIAEFVRGLGNGAAELIDAAADAMETLAQALKDNHDRIVGAAQEIGWYIIDGLTLGLADKAYKFINKIASFCSDAWDKVKDFFGIASPSKLMRKAGRWIGDGMILGIGDKSSAAARAGEELSAAAYNPVKAALSELENGLGDDMTLTPIVKPELDLSNVHDFNTNGAFSLTADKLTAEQVKAPVSSVDDTQNAQQGIVFNQYNNSPKALNEAELYRQTGQLIRMTAVQQSIMN